MLESGFRVKNLHSWQRKIEVQFSKKKQVFRPFLFEVRVGQLTLLKLQLQRQNSWYLVGLRWRRRIGTREMLHLHGISLGIPLLISDHTLTTRRQCSYFFQAWQLLWLHRNGVRATHSDRQLNPCHMWVSKIQTTDHKFISTLAVFEQPACQQWGFA